MAGAGATSGGDGGGSLGRRQCSNRVLVLSDIRDIFIAQNQQGQPWLGSGELVGALVEMEGRPWAEWNRGRPMTTNSLARLLAPHGIGPGNKKVLGKVLKGYKLDQFTDAFARYLPVTASATATPLQPAENLGVAGVEHPLPHIAGSGCHTPEKPQKPAAGSGVAVEYPPGYGGDDEEAAEWTH
jgi:hypothetical protein